MVIHISNARAGRAGAVTPTVYPARVERLRAAVQAGTYRVDPKAVAQRIADALRGTRPTG